MKQICQIFKYSVCYETSNESGFSLSQLEKLYDAFCVLDLHSLVKPTEILFSKSNSAVEYCIENSTSDCDLKEKVGSHSVTFVYYINKVQTVL